MSQDGSFGDLLNSIKLLTENGSKSSTSSNTLFDYLSRPINPQPSILTNYMTIPPTPLRPITPARTVFPFLAIPKTQTDLVRRITGDSQRLLKIKFIHSKARKVPLPEEVAFNEAKTVETSVLHIDIRDSSNIVENFTPENALKIYKIFHNSMVLVARFKGGRIRTFAGDRIGVVFDIDDIKRTQGVKTGLLMQSVLEYVVNPLLKSTLGYSLQYGIGIDFGKMMVGKIGGFGTSNNDLVWTGKAMNKASKIADITTSVTISEEVYSKMERSLKEDFNMLWQEINSPSLGKLYKFVGVVQSPS